MANVYATAAFDMRALNLGEFFSRMESYSSAISGEIFPTTVHGFSYIDYFQLTSFGSLAGNTLRVLSHDDLSQPASGAPYNSALSGSAAGLTLYDGGSGDVLTERWHISGISMNPTQLLDAIETFTNADEINLVKAELSGADFFELSAFGDYAMGYGGADLLRGNEGDDSLRGGMGRDDLYGGNGADDFIFDDRETGKGATRRDVIYDFVAGSDDLDLRLIDANAARAGDQAFRFGGSTAGANQVWFVQSGGNVIVYGDTNGDRTADFEIELRGVASLAKGDFLL